MYPTLLRIGDFEITSFGVLVAWAHWSVCGFSGELARSGCPKPRSMRRWPA